MSWYSLLGIGIAAWVTASVAVAITLGCIAARRRRVERKLLAPVVRLAPRVAPPHARTRAAG